MSAKTLYTAHVHTVGGREGAARSSDGQLDITIGISYVLLLGIVGTLMVTESVRAIMRARQGKPVELRRPGSHTWIHGLPFKIRFKQSKIYVSAIPVWGIGFIIGFVGPVMGIGGGFLLVPMLIYLLRVPTSIVIGTSMVLTLVTMAFATVMHAATNHLVDIVLALLTGYFLMSAQQPVPPTSPHIRDAQRWQGEVCWEWLAERRGWS